MNQNWSLAGLVWTFLRMAILYVAALAGGYVFQTGQTLFLFAFASGVFGTAALYLVLLQKPDLADTIRPALVIGSLVGLALVLLHTTWWVISLTQVGLWLLADLGNLAALILNCLVIAVDTVLMFELQRGGR